ncbi:hypothetical protein [Paenibacillus ottowii]|uniref:hypothetical protein n=1 Tax=Paenibacillus ottowii TaxID=2315729 RepID=UPI00138FE801|nr:hypothetical protein [Paenibacillus ottowii]
MNVLWDEIKIASLHNNWVFRPGLLCIFRDFRLVLLKFRNIRIDLEMEIKHNEVEFKREGKKRKGKSFAVKGRKEFKGGRFLLNPFRAKSHKVQAHIQPHYLPEQLHRKMKFTRQRM